MKQSPVGREKVVDRAIKFGRALSHTMFDLLDAEELSEMFEYYLEHKEVIDAAANLEDADDWMHPMDRKKRKAEDVE